MSLPIRPEIFYNIIDVCSHFLPAAVFVYCTSLADDH